MSPPALIIAAGGRRALRLVRAEDVVHPAELGLGALQGGLGGRLGRRRAVSRALRLPEAEGHYRSHYLFERCIGSSLELVQRGLQRGGVGLARVGGAGDTVDGTAVGSHGLLLLSLIHISE